MRMNKEDKEDDNEDEKNHIGDRVDKAVEDAINTDDNEATAVVAWNDPNAEDPEPEHPCITIPEMTSNHPPTMQIKFQITPQNSQGKFFIIFFSNG